MCMFFPGFTSQACAEYLRCAKLPGAIYAMCEDYRAATGVEHDRETREPK